LCRSFSFLFFFFFSGGYNYNHMYCSLWLPVILFVFSTTITCIFCYDCLQEICFSPCCNNCSYTCGHKYHVLGITDMSKVFFSKF
jgi:hypothetical protein